MTKGELFQAARALQNLRTAQAVPRLPKVAFNFLSRARVDLQNLVMAGALAHGVWKTFDFLDEMIADLEQQIAQEAAPPAEEGGS